MATIGLDKLYYAPITESPTTGDETYGTPVMLAKAISAELSIELAEATLYADDGAAEVVKEFKNGKLTLGVDNIGRSVAAALTGAQVDENGVLISASEDGGAPVAIGFRAKKANGHYKYFWFYRVKFGVPSTNLATKGDSITFSTPTIEGTVMRRNKVDGNDNHPWKAEADQDDTDIEPSVISGWYTSVYEPSFAASAD
jgi:phi13 family phage major tail protein